MTEIRSWQSPNPAKRAVERFWLLYTPVWGAVAGLVMVTGWAETWGDLPLMVLGFGLALPAAFGPLLLREGGTGAPAWWQSTAFKLPLSVVLFSLALNWSQTPYFFEVLHMHFGFRATITIDSNPVFLYAMTIAYFSTYCALCLAAYRWMRARGGLLGGLAPVAAPLAMAFLETVLNANPFMTSLFCFDDLPLMLWFGTLSYAVAFVCVLPVWLRIDEQPEPAPRPAWTTITVWIAAAVYIDTLVLELLRHHVAPHVTQVVDGARGLGDFATSCLTGG